MLRPERTSVATGGHPQAPQPRESTGRMRATLTGMEPGIDHRHLDYLRHVQAGVIARRQLIEAGLARHDVARLLRRDLTRVWPGVYVDHNGPLTRTQREWAAVLAAWPAALCGESALPRLSPPQMHVAIGLHRKLIPFPGSVLHPTAHLDSRVDWRAAPPRMRPQEAVVDVMSARITAGDVAGAYAALAHACFAATSVDRVARVLETRRRVPGRRLIQGMLDDLRTGASSVLERGYLTRVERPHGLPRPARQRVSLATGRRTDQDVHYEDFGLVVELDGRAIHDSPEAWDADAGRDLAELAASGAVTARVTYGLVFGDGCRTAGRIGQILRGRGWAGTVRRCPSCPGTP